MQKLIAAARYVYRFVTDFPRTKGCTRYGYPARAYYAHLYALGLD